MSHPHDAIMVRNIGKVVENGSERYRIIVGDPMPSSERKTFPVDAGKAVDAVTGTIGFLDFRGFYTKDAQGNEAQVAELLRIGIEPGYERQGYGLGMVECLAGVAAAKGVESLVSHEAGDENFPNVRGLHELGFSLDRRYQQPHVMHLDDKQNFFPYAAPLPLELPEGQ